MLKIKYYIRPYVKSTTGQVALKVRWNHSHSEVSFFTNVWAEINKWDSDLMRAKKGTTHNVRGMSFSYTAINEAIAEYREEIESIFDKCSLKNAIPTSDELKRMVNEALGRGKRNVLPAVDEKKKNMREMFDWFVDECG